MCLNSEIRNREKPLLSEGVQNTRVEMLVPAPGIQERLPPLVANAPEAAPKRARVDVGVREYSSKRRGRETETERRRGDCFLSASSAS